MNERRRSITALLLVAASPWLVRAAHAQQPSLREKVDYIAIEPQPAATDDRIEVTEFFWYGCPHCYNLQPALEAWLKRKPADVEFRRIPAIFRESWAAHARLFYTLEALRELERLHQAVYRAIHADRETLTTASGTAEWAQRHGIDAARWSAVYNSADVERKVQQAAAHTRAYKVPGTPSLVVDGRYLTSSGMAESMQALIGTLDALIVHARERRSAR